MKIEIFLFALINMLFFNSNLSNAQDFNWLWAHNVGGTSAEKAESIAVDALGNTYLTGYFYSPFIVFGTETGNVVSITSDGPTRLWQFDAAGGIAGPIVRDKNSLFFASKDTNVYRVDIVDSKNKEFVWKYQTAAVLDRAPRVSEKIVYQHVAYKGLIAINKENGKLVWEVPGGIDLLAEATDKAYVIAQGKLVVMDNKNAKHLYSVNFAGVTKHSANMTDSNIYIANNAGRIACLKPIE